MPNLNIYLLGTTSKEQAWGPRQLIAAESQEQAMKLAKWDYCEETMWCEQVHGTMAEGDPRILFTHPGD